MSLSATMWFLDVLIRRILLKIWKTPQPRIGNFLFLALKPVVWNFCLPLLVLRVITHLPYWCMLMKFAYRQARTHLLPTPGMLTSNLLWCFLNISAIGSAILPVAVASSFTTVTFPFSSGKPIFACWRKTQPGQRCGNVATDTRFKNEIERFTWQRWA